MVANAPRNVSEAFKIWISAPSLSTAALLKLKSKVVLFSSIAIFVASICPKFVLLVKTMANLEPSLKATSPSTVNLFVPKLTIP